MVHLFPSSVLIFVVFGMFLLKVLYVVLVYKVLQVCKNEIIEMKTHFFILKEKNRQI